MAKPKKTKVWITQYALTSGIFTTMVELDDEQPKMVTEHHKRHFTSMVCYHKPHWWLTEEEAQTRFEQMRKAALASAQKRVTSLQGMKFEVRENYK